MRNVKNASVNLSQCDLNVGPVVSDHVIRTVDISSILKAMLSPSGLAQQMQPYVETARAVEVGDNGTLTEVKASSVKGNRVEVSHVQDESDLSMDHSFLSFCCETLFITYLFIYCLTSMPAPRVLYHPHRPRLESGGTM